MDDLKIYLAAAVTGGIGCGVLSFGWLKSSAALRELGARYRPIVDAEADARRIRADTAKLERESETTRTARLANADRTVAELHASATRLRTQIAADTARRDVIATELTSVEEHLDYVEVGIYRPHFTYENSEQYKKAIIEVRDAQKLLVKLGQATTCATTWQVGGSAKDGERMVKQTEKLILRAFNAEAEAATANVTWNNVETMRTRIRKAFEVLNRHGTVLQITLSNDYLQARPKELEFVYEAAEKKRQEKEEQRQQRAAQREEERVQRELRKVQDDAERDEVKYERALERARSDLETARDGEREQMLARILALETDLAAAHDRKERAIAQAQLTKVGHVYIISNVGAFGEGVVKIGMTRRLEPEERIQELGDASVPFPFDLHALIYSENAPELEARLHEHFWDHRLNWSNDRKEFFKLDLAAVEQAIRDLGLQTELQMIAEAREYRETIAARTAIAEVLVTAQSSSSSAPDLGLSA